MRILLDENLPEGLIDHDPLYRLLALSIVLLVAAIERPVRLDLRVELVGVDLHVIVENLPYMLTGLR